MSHRRFSFLIGWQFRNILSKNDSIELKYQTTGLPEKSLILPLVWLRDHCMSEKCYNSPTHQRKANGTQMFSRAIIKNIENSKDSLTVKWIDGHESSFEINSLLHRSTKSRMNEDWVTLWDSTLPKIPRSSKEFSDFAESFAKYGVVIVEGIDHSAEATEELCKSLVPVHDTFFGKFWTFSNSATKDEPAYEDTAYGNDGIGPHTDGTYFNQTPGIQVFHCLQPAEKGGKTVLVDSWRCAKDLSKEHFDILSSFKISHHYLEGNPPGSSIYSLSEEKPVIEVDSAGNIKQIRFNPYDRAPFNCLSGSENDAISALKFYEAYESFSKLCHDSKYATEIALKPGSVIFIDNFRVLHSRTGFEGYRRMCGCYLSRDNFYAKARPILLNKTAQN